MSVVLEDKYVLTVEQREKNNQLWDKLSRAFQDSPELCINSEDDIRALIKEARAEKQKEEQHARCA